MMVVEGFPNKVIPQPRHARRSMREGEMQIRPKLSAERDVLRRSVDRCRRRTPAKGREPRSDGAD